MPNAEELLERAQLHSTRFKGKAAPSGMSWDEVRKRVGTLHLPSHLTSNVDSGNSNGDLTTLRALSLYCGRAGIACALKKRGWIVKVLDIDRDQMVASCGPSGPDCDNGLEEEDMVNLDFLDFAVGFFNQEITIARLDHIDDGMDCTTFTYLATSKHQRNKSNFFMGVSEEAMATK